MELQGRNLRLNMRGEDVKLLQEELDKLGHPTGSDTPGRFGRDTLPAGTLRTAI